MLRRLLIAALALAVLAYGGYLLARPKDEPEFTASPAPTGAALARAQEVAGAWPGSDLQQVWRTGYYPGSADPVWYPPHGLRTQAERDAMFDGRFDLQAEPESVPATEDVVFEDDGRQRLTLPLLDPAAALRRVAGQRRCSRPPCESRLALTGVRPGERRLLTSRGEATVPVWEFTPAGYEEPLAVAAVEPQQPRPPEHRTEPPSAGGTEVAGLWEVQSLGRSLHGDLLHSHCVQPLPGEVYETDDAVVLISRSGPPKGADCEVRDRSTSTEFRLARPLDGRAVLDLSGAPVSLCCAPDSLPRRT
ncbi:hypothetical protein ACF9IK_26500 [Kitasatospora hibisci]|uniref:hypothetical protein n=1 Tax=Kitasatospora hibisci TaxID=3369522 RepID=UPI0037548B6F